jgi:hypothetical protein
MAMARSLKLTTLPLVRAATMFRIGAQIAA